jgi:FMN-dependent NADH-azoreductase
MDMQKGYLEMLLGFIGFTDIKNILIEPTLAAPDDVASTVESAKELASEIARKL